VPGGAPLAGVKVIELGGIGPGPHAGMVLADLGADVVRVRRPAVVGIASAAEPGEAGRHQTAGMMPSEDRDLLHRGKRIVDLDIKTQPGVLLELAANADVLGCGDLCPGVQR
jgi:alpha-methylacyl-CoA racemase